MGLETSGSREIREHRPIDDPERDIEGVGRGERGTQPTQQKPGETAEELERRKVLSIPEYNPSIHNKKIDESIRGLNAEEMANIHRNLAPNYVLLSMAETARHEIAKVPELPTISPDTVQKAFGVASVIVGTALMAWGGASIFGGGGISLTGIGAIIGIPLAAQGVAAFGLGSALYLAGASALRSN